MTNGKLLACATGVAMAALAGCSSNGAPSAPLDVGDEGLVPPANPSGPTTSVTTQHAYAIRQLYLGGTDRTYEPSPTAWQNYGYDLDGKVTTATSTDVCTPYSGAAAAAQVDGTRGIDNSFGENLLPIFEDIAGVELQSMVDTEINAGRFSDLFVVKGWDDANATQTATGLAGVLLVGNEYPTTPSWTTADHWPIDDAYLTPSALGTDPIAGASIQLSTAYVVDGEFVSGSRVEVPIELEFSGETMKLLVHHAIVSWQNDGAGHIHQGTIAGVLSTSEFVEAFLDGVYIDHDVLCSTTNPGFAITVELSQASDILHDGTNVPGVPCDDISIGLGFDADEVAIPVAGDVAAPPPVPPDPCAADAGD